MAEANSQEMRAQLVRDRQRLIAENAALQQSLIAANAVAASSAACATQASPRPGKLRRLRCRLVAIHESIAEDCGSDDDLTSASNGSTHVPSSLDSSCCSVEEEVCDDRTTLLLRNLPAQLSTRDLVRALEAAGLLSACTFAYMPADPTSARSFGYAVVDLADHAAAERAREHFEGFQAWSCRGAEGCSVTWNPARQGLDALKRRYWDVESMAPVSRPYVLASP